MSVYPNTGQFDLDLQSSRQGWSGTFGLLIRAAVEDITTEGDYGPVEVTYDEGVVITDVLHGFGFGDDVIHIGSLALEVDRIERFRA